MIHLKPLPGSPLWGGSMGAVLRAARADATILAEEGFDGLLVENFGDRPYYPDSVPPATVAAMSAVLCRLKDEFAGLVWGVNVLRNDAGSAVSIAAAAGADFVRVNVHCGATVTDQGILQGCAHETLRLRSLLAPRVAILADARVKHGRGLVDLPVSEEVADLTERGLADGVLITGPRTGAPADPSDLRSAVAAADPVPVLAASGVSAANVAECLDVCRGVIVGSSLKKGGRAESAVDRARTREFMARVRSAGAGNRKQERR
jgi:uncharacterized protein